MLHVAKLKRWGWVGKSCLVETAQELRVLGLVEVEIQVNEDEQCTPSLAARELSNLIRPWR